MSSDAQRALRELAVMEVLGALALRRLGLMDDVLLQAVCRREGMSEEGQVEFAAMVERAFSFYAISTQEERDARGETFWRLLHEGEVSGA